MNFFSRKIRKILQLFPSKRSIKNHLLLFAAVDHEIPLFCEVFFQCNLVDKEVNKRRQIETIKAVVDKPHLLLALSLNDIIVYVFRFLNSALEHRKIYKKRPSPKHIQHQEMNVILGNL